MQKSVKQDGKTRRQNKARIMTKYNRRKNLSGIRLIIIKAMLLLVGLIAVAAVGLVVYKNVVSIDDEFGEIVEDKDNPVPRPELDVELLDVNPYSRPGTKLERVKGIVIHYTANPGAGAINNRDYFNSLKDTHYTSASSHFIVGLEGEIIQCIPTGEIAYASNNRNKDTLSIENCHINEDGSFEKETYDSLVHLTAWLTVKFGLKTKHIIRHYDVTGKMCPKYFVEHEDAWKKFKEDVQNYIDECNVRLK